MNSPTMKPIISQTASYDMLLIGADKLMNEMNERSSVHPFIRSLNIYNSYDMLLIGADKLMNEMNDRSSVHPFIVHPFIRSLNFY